ncbi:MAG: outer membrane protein assembly factor BamE [Sphingomonadaceae bacterium]
MTIPLRSAVAALALSALVLAPGCSRIRDHQGYIVKETAASAIQPGVDTKETVSASLGRPSFVGQFDDDDWYYVSRVTKQFGYSKPDPVEQTVLRISFDEAGRVVRLERSGLERVVSINPMDDKTPTLGRERSLFEELFGNVGQVGAVGESGGTIDNPN